MTHLEQNKIRKEVKGLRQRMAIVERAWNSQKARCKKFIQKNKELKQENNKFKKEITELEKENAQLRAQLETASAQKQVLQGMIFKPSVCDSSDGKQTRRRGAQTGHKGYGRKKPKRIDQEKHVYLTNCPDCNNELEQSNQDLRTNPFVFTQVCEIIM